MMKQNLFKTLENALKNYFKENGDVITKSFLLLNSGATTYHLYRMSV